MASPFHAYFARGLLLGTASATDQANMAPSPKSHELNGPKPARPLWTTGIPALICIALGIVYLWYSSIGTWTHLSQTSTYYYRMLADAFLKGSPSLEVQPDPRLLDLSNPYSAQARDDIPYLMDASLYKGKYYLYYGPVPALFEAGFIFLFGGGFSDGYVVFASSLGALIFSTLILCKVWRKWFNHLPIHLLYVSIALVGLIHPIPWMLNTARIYEAAVLSASALLVSGVYFAFDTLAGNRSSPLRLAMSSLLWGLALGTRFSQIGAVAVFGGIVMFRLIAGWRTAKWGRGALVSLATFVAPIGTIILVLGWYNYIRFGSPLELGYRYQLLVHQGVNLSKILDVFNPSFFLPNVYNYLLNPFGVSSSFPFVKTVRGSHSLYLQLRNGGGGYVTLPVSGILLTSPFVLFFGWIGYHTVRQLLKNRPPLLKAIRLHALSKQPSAQSLAIALGAGSVFNLALLLFFYATSARYELDFLLLLAIAAVVSAWALYTRYQDIAWGRRLIASLITISAGYSIVLSLFLAISGETNRFQVMNPALFEQMSHLFGR